MNNLFSGIPFSQEDQIHEHVQVSFVLGRRTKGNLTGRFDSFLQVFERGFLQKFSHLTGRNGRLKPGELLSLIGHIRYKQDNFQYHCFDIQGAQLCQTPGIF